MKVGIRHSDASTALTEVVELAPLRPIRHRMGKQYMKAYFDHFQKSDPEEDQDDRNALYCL